MLRLLLHCSGPILATTALVGLFVRRRRHESAVLPIWLAAHIAVPVFALLRPDLHTWSFWIVKELTYNLLYLLLGVELAAKLCSHLTWVAPRAQRFVVVVLIATAALVATTPAGPVSTTLLPRLTAALALLFVGVFVLATRYGLPLTPLHATLLRGLTLCLLLFTFTLQRVVDDTRFADWANASAFALLLACLVRAAWQREAPPPATPETVHWLWPWKSSS
jgi:hypothetical protein